MTIISHNHDLVFVHIPKCGGSSIEIEFQRHLRWGDYVIGSTREGEILHTDIFCKLYGITKHSTAAELKASIGTRFMGMRVAAVVREPLKIVESHYRYSKKVFTWIASAVAARNPGVSADHVRLHAWEMVRNGKFDDSVPFAVLKLRSGAIKAGVLSHSFEEFLAKVADDRWTNYLSEHVTDGSGAMLAHDILKLEEPDSIERYFQALVGPAFHLGHDNIGVNVPTPWAPRDRDRYYELMAADYKTFGYKRPA